MIGWNVDVGYCIDTPTSIEEVTWTDKNRYFTILTYIDLNTIPKGTILRPGGEFPSVLNSILEDDFYYIYPIVMGYNSGGSYENRIYQSVPSISKMYPNLLSFAISKKPAVIYPFIYFKTLSRAIWYSQDYIKIYSVNSGSLTQIANITKDINNSFQSIYQNLYYLVYYPYNKGDIDYNSLYILRARDSNNIWIENREVDTDTRYVIQYLFDNKINPDFETNLPNDNPYEPGGPSGPGGGNGTFDDESDQIIDSSLPTISAANTGFTRIYNPSLSQVQSLARYLWTDESIIETIWNHIKKYFEDPMQAIIGFNLVPVPVPNGGTENFALMYIDTGVAMTVAASQFVDVDCGIFELKEYYGSALDYSPNTKVSCFLPFIGTVSLNTDEVMGRTLQVKYRVDICSGSCVAKISVDGNFIYQYSGHCAINIPISSADFSSYVTAAISVAKLAGGALAAGAAGVVGAGVADAAQQTNQVVTTTQITNTARNPATGRQITTGTTTRVETREAPMDQSSTQASFSGLTPQNIANTVGQIMTSKPSIEHSGSFSGNSGYLGIRRPFLIIERPNMCMPSNFQTLNGFPSMITLELSTCKGFTRVQQVQLTGLSATNPEQAEILQLLKTGVVL